jgi:hypothetical protein
MSARAEQLMLEYLSRVADAAHGVLRSDERLAFVTRLRASIERQRQATGAHELGQVRRLLAKFGEPSALVARERRRLDAARAAADGTAPAADGVTGAARDAARRAGTVAPAVNRAVRTAGGVRNSATRRATLPAKQRSRGRAPQPIRVGRSGATTPEQPQVPQPAFDPLSLIRRFRREALALLLLGPGAIVLPFPLWLIGAAIGLTSWVWSVRDKSIGLVGPCLVTAAGVGFIGALNKNPSIPVDLHAYLNAAHEHAGILIRVSAAAGALYLGARLLRRDKATRRRSANR